MGCCCGVPKADNSSSPNCLSKQKDKTNKYQNSSRSSSNLCQLRLKKTIYPDPSNYNEEEEINQSPKYYSFKQYFDEVSNPTVNGYRFLHLIGNGAMSSVYLCETDCDKYASKVYCFAHLCKPTLGGEEPGYVGVNREIEIMSKMSFLYLLSIVDAFDDFDTNSRFLIFPFAENGNVQSLLEKKELSDQMFCLCFHQTAVALAYMHSLNIVHRDIKPENILCFSEDYFVLSDFSVSAELTDCDQLFEDTKGSPAFLSPEEISGDPYPPKPADVWAYGISLYQAAFGKLPYNLDEANNRSIANTIIIVSQLIETTKLTFPNKTINGNKPDQNLLKLLTKILDKNPKNRPSFDDIQKHPYFKQVAEVTSAQIEEEKMLAEQENSEVL